MPFDPEVPQVAPEPQIPPFDVALKELVEALGAAPAAQVLVEGVHRRRSLTLRGRLRKPFDNLYPKF